MVALRKINVRAGAVSIDAGQLDRPIRRLRLSSTHMLVQRCGDRRHVHEVPHMPMTSKLRDIKR